MPAQPLHRFRRVDVPHHIQIQIVGGIIVKCCFAVDAQRPDKAVVPQLRGAEQEGQEVVVVEAPDAVGAGGLEVVCCL